MKTNAFAHPVLALNSVRWLGLATSLLIASGCALGPDFQQPQVQPVAAWKPQAASNAPSQISSASIDPHWWRLYRDAGLSDLIEQVASANLDVQEAASRLQQSRDLQAVANGAALPSVDAKGGYRRQRATSEGHFDPSGANGTAPFSFWQAGFDASWELDIWGRVRRQEEVAAASVQAAEDLQRGILVAVQAETARDYIQLRAVQQQRKVTEENLQVAKHSLQLIEVRLANGVATQLQVAEARAHLAAVSAGLPALEMQEGKLINALSYLVGGQPHALQQQLAVTAAIPAVPSRVPVGLPSELAQRRPDIRAAAAQLHAATAEIGVAQADFYPRINLSGSYGFEALQLSTFGNWSTRSYGFGPSFSLPIFEGGRLRGMLQLRENQQQQAAIHFQKVVLKAWHEVDDALTNYRTSQQQNAQLVESVQQSQIALSTAQQQYLAGAVDFLNVLTVQKQLLSTQQAQVQSQAQVALAMVGLYKALGGGWQQQNPQKIAVATMR